MARKDLEKFVEKYLTYIEALEKIDQLQQQIDESFTEEDVKDLIKAREETIKFLTQQLAEKDNKIKELEDYKSRNTDYKMYYESTAMNYHEICEVYKNNLDTLIQQIEEKDKEIANLEVLIIENKNDMKEIQNFKVGDDEYDLADGDARNDIKYQLEYWRSQLENKDKEIESLTNRINYYENMFAGQIKQTGDMQKELEGG